MEEYYLNDFHKQHCEASMKEVELMKQHPYSFEEAKAQVERIHAHSQRGMRETKENNLSKKE